MYKQERWIFFDDFGVALLIKVLDSVEYLLWVFLSLAYLVFITLYKISTTHDDDEFHADFGYGDDLQYNDMYTTDNREHLDKQHDTTQHLLDCSQVKVVKGTVFVPWIIW